MDLARESAGRSFEGEKNLWTILSSKPTEVIKFAIFPTLIKSEEYQRGEDFPERKLKLCKQTFCGFRNRARDNLKEDLVLKFVVLYDSSGGKGKLELNVQQ